MRKSLYSFYKSFSFAILVLFLLTNTFTSFGQQIKGTAKGRVLTNKGEPAENISVTLKGTKIATVTDGDGNFKFKAPEGSYLLIVSEVGAKRQEKNISITSGQTLIISDFVIDNVVNGLDEVNINRGKKNKFKRTKSDDAAKMPLNNLENAQVVNTISSELMQEQLVFSVDDAMRNAPGIQKMWEATGRSGDGGTYYNSRGFFVQSTFRNGLAGNVSSTIDAVNLDKIEVIKGPSATLFGSALSSYGGIINRVTKKPYDTFGGEVSVAGGGYDFERISAYINAPLDKAKKLLFRLNTAYNHEGSFQNNGFTRSVAVAPSLLYKVNDKLSISVDAELINGKNIGKPIFFFADGVPISSIGHDRADQLKIDYKQSYMGDDLTQNSRSDNFYGEVKYKISNSWTSRTNISSTHSYSDGFGGYYYILPGDSISRNDQSSRKSSDNMIDIQQNFNGDFKIGRFRNRVVAGLDFFRENSNQYYVGTYFDAVSLTENQNYSNFNKANLNAAYAKPGSLEDPLGYTYPSIYKKNTYSAYLSDVFNITDQLIASAALRADRFDNEGNYDPSSNSTYGAFKQTAFSPKFGLVYQPIKDHLSLFANYQNSFNNQSGTTEDNRPLKPEQANQKEAGVKLDWFDGKLSSTVSYYDIKVKDIVRPSPVDPNLSIQDGTQYSKGIETEVMANLVPGLNIVAGFTYNDSKLTKTSDASIEGLRPGTASSPYLANFYASYRFTRGIVKGLGFGLGGNYASDNKVINSRTMGIFTLPAYTIFNASAFYDTKNYRFGAKMDNITNKKYWIGYTTLTPERLRSFALSAAYKF